MTLHIPVPVLFNAPSTAIATFAPVVSVVFSFALLATASMQVSLAFIVVCQSSPEHATINCQSFVPEPEVSNISPRETVIALLRERLSLRDANAAKQDEAFIARENCVLE